MWPQRGARWVRRQGCLGLAWLALIAATPGCDEPAAPTPAVAEAPAANAVLEVDTVRVRRGSIVQRITAPGSLNARRESRVGVEVGGRIQHVFVREGDRVEAGDPLFQVDPEPYEIAERQAEAGLDLAAAERAQIEADLKRAIALRRNNVVAEDEVDRLTNAVTVARARERQASEALGLARRNLEQTLVRAPFAGSVARRLVDEGTTALVQPQTIVVVLQETALLEAEAAIPETHMASLRLRDPVLLYVEGVPHPIQTEVSAVGDTIDPATRTFVVRMRVPNPEHQLKAGVFARVEILPQAKSDVLVLPRAAIRSEDGRTRVFTVRDGRTVDLPVELGIVTEDAAEVLRGVRVDTEVIVGEAAQHVAPGMRVRVRGDAS